MTDTVRKTALMRLTLLAWIAAGAGAATAAETDPHAGVACAACHRERVAQAAFAPGGARPAPQSRLCRDCHRSLDRNPDAAASALGFHDDARADCTRCHTFHERGRIKSAAGDLLTGGSALPAGAAAHCSACHRKGANLAHLSPAHRLAASLYHREAKSLASVAPSQGCLNCHAAGSTSSWQDETGQERLTFNLHATHPLGVQVVAGSGRDERSLRADLDPRLPLFEQRIECQTCHCLTAATTDLLVPFEQPYDLCLGCHKLRNPQPSPRPQALMATMLPGR